MADIGADATERRLSTILAADVAEYSRLMRADEDGTLAALTAARTIVDALIAQHRGRIANTAGDAVLAEFPSVAAGLAGALAIQEALREQNSRLEGRGIVLQSVSLNSKLGAASREDLLSFLKPAGLP